MRRLKPKQSATNYSKTLTKKETDKMMTMYQYSKTFDQELLPKSLLDEIDDFFSGFVDGAPDASATSKTANHLQHRLETNRGKVFIQ